MGLLPFFALLLLWLICVPQVQSWRGGLLTALVLWGVFIVAITEMLSLFHALTPLPLVVIWGLAILLLAGCVYQQRQPLRRQWQNLSLRPTSLVMWGIWGGLGVLVIEVGIVAIVAPPNTWDSMTYHMARVFYWTQFQSVAHYPAHVLRELYQPPFAEFLIFHTYLLAGSDQWANLGQWVAWLIGSVGVSVIAARLGANRDGQLFSGIIALTTGTVILQASSAKNDLMVALWIVCLAYLVLDTLQQLKIAQPVSPYRLPLIGAAAGLAILTKGTAYFYVAPCLLWLGLYLVWRSRFPLPRVADVWQGVKAALIIGGIALLVNLGHYTRNQAVFNTPLTPDAESGFYGADLITPATLISNVIRNLALHVFIPERIELSFPIQVPLYARIDEIHQWLGVDASDPRTTFVDTRFGQEFLPWWYNVHEGLGGNFTQLFLFGLVLLQIALTSRWRNSIIGRYCLLILLQFGLFCWLTKWQPTGARLHTSFFMMMSPLIGTVLIRSGRPATMMGFQGLLIGIGLFWGLNTQPRPLLPANLDSFPLSLGFYTSPYLADEYLPSVLLQDRAAMYFSVSPGRIPLTAELIEQVERLDCAEFGMIYGNAALIYPVWKLMQDSIPNLQIHDVLVTNESAKLAQQPFFQEFQPCALVVADMVEKDSPLLVNGQLYERSWSNDMYILLTPPNKE